MSQVLKIINIGNDQTHVNSNQYHQYAEFFCLFYLLQYMRETMVYKDKYGLQEY